MYYEDIKTTEYNFLKLSLKLSTLSVDTCVLLQLLAL